MKIYITTASLQNGLGSWSPTQKSFSSLKFLSCHYCAPRYKKSFGIVSKSVQIDPIMPGLYSQDGIVTVCGISSSLIENISKLITEWGVNRDARHFIKLLVLQLLKTATKYFTTLHQSLGTMGTYIKIILRGHPNLPVQLRVYQCNERQTIIGIFS